MKKSLLFLFVFLCSSILFTGCGNDDKDNSWEQLVGVYKGETLVLNYGEEVLTGKEVAITSDGGSINLILKDVIPGENETKIVGVQIANGEFQGAATTTNASVTYKGSNVITKATESGDGKALTLSLDVVMNDPASLVKTYSLTDYKTGDVEYGGSSLVLPIAGAMYSNWTNPDPEKDYVLILSGMFRTAGGILLPQVLHSVTLEANGNIRAEIMPKPAIQFDPSWIMNLIITGTAPDEKVVNALIPQKGWTKSPANLAFWYQKDSKLYVKLNISTIVSQAIGNGSTDLSSIIDLVLNGDAASIKQLLGGVLGADLSKISDKTFETLLDWVKNGIPMTVKKENGHTYMYLDKEAVDPLLSTRDGGVDEWGSPVLTSDLTELWNILASTGKIPEEMKAAQILLLLVNMNYAGTSDFGLGLDMK